MTDRTTRAERMARPHIRDVIRAVAEEHGACPRPVQLRKTSLDTGQTEQVLIPCGATLASVCPPCAERSKVLWAAHCREGWHLEHEPIAQAAPADDYQRWLAATRIDLQAGRDQAQATGEDTGELDDLIAELDGELRRLGIRGSLGTGASGKPKARRNRSQLSTNPIHHSSGRQPERLDQRGSVLAVVSVGSLGLVRQCDDRRYRPAPGGPPAGVSRSRSRDARAAGPGRRRVPGPALVGGRSSRPPLVCAYRDG